MMQAAEITLDNAERYLDLGYAIVYYSKRKGMTQGQVAEMIGISRQHMGGNRGAQYDPGCIAGCAFQYRSCVGDRAL